MHVWFLFVYMLFLSALSMCSNALFQPFPVPQINENMNKRLIWFDLTVFTLRKLDDSLLVIRSSQAVRRQKRL